MKPELFILIGGILHLGILSAGAVMPVVLNWKVALGRLDAVSRHVIWTHGAFVVSVIAAFGAVSLFFAGELCSGGPLARAVCLFIALFWGARLLLQFFLFNPTVHLKNFFLKLGYHGLTVVFLFNAIVYGWAALAIH